VVPIQPVAANISKDHTAFIFRVQQTKKISSCTAWPFPLRSPKPLMPWCSVTTQKACIQ